MMKAFFAGVSAATLLAVAPIASADTAQQGAGYQAAQALAQQLVTAAKTAETADQGQGKSNVAVEADVEAAVLAQIRDSSASPDVVAEAIRIARKAPGLDNTALAALGSALQLALGVTVPGPGAVGGASGHPGGAPPFGVGSAGGGGGGGSGYRSH